MRQLTETISVDDLLTFSKLPMRQLTIDAAFSRIDQVSKLPMRQLTFSAVLQLTHRLSKLPMRQLTMPERKKNPTARALIHLFSTLTQIYSCFEIY